MSNKINLKKRIILNFIELWDKWKKRKRKKDRQKITVRTGNNKQLSEIKMSRCFVLKKKHSSKKMSLY